VQVNQRYILRLKPFNFSKDMQKMSTLRTLDDFELINKRVLIRVDINIPMQGGIITDSD